ncbi:MAG: PH domain-containing protein [Euzebya sp.]
MGEQVSEGAGTDGDTAGGADSHDAGLGIPTERLAQVLPGLHPAPPLPLTQSFQAGLAPLLRALGQAAGGILAGRKARRVLDLIGDRFTVSVSPDGITARSIVRRRTMRWDEMESIQASGLGFMIGRHVVGRLLDGTVGRYVRIPGLRWLARRVARTLVDFATRLSVRPHDDNALVIVGATAQDESDVTFDGLLGLVVVLSRGFNDAVFFEASARGITMTREDLS